LRREGAPAPVALQSALEKSKDANRENEQGVSAHRLEVTHETIGGEPSNLHNLVSGKE